MTGNLVNPDWRSLTDGTASLQMLHLSFREEKLRQISIAGT